MGEVAQKKKGVIFSQASGVRKIPQLKTNILHCYPGWYFVSVENKSYAAAAVVQMAAVWLALSGCLGRWGSSH